MILTPENRIKDFTEKGWWGTDTLYSLFVDACNESGESEALVDAPNRNEFTSGQPKRLTFNQIRIEVDRYASIFYEAGFRKDDKVILQLPNIVELAILYIALSKLGIIISPVPVQYGKYEITKIINDIKPKGYIAIASLNSKNFTQGIKDAFHDKHTLFSVGDAEGFINLENNGHKENSLADTDKYVKSISNSACLLYTSPSPRDRG